MDDGQSDSRAAAEESDRNLSSPPRPTPEDISRRAYERYLARGGTDGSAMDDWLAAESELCAEGAVGISNHPPAEELRDQASLPKRGTRRVTGND
jgi:hypothetical protein